MFETNLESVWTQTLTVMEEEMLRASYETWLRNTTPLALEENRLTIGVPNEFARDWIRDKYSPTLEQTLAAVIGEPVELQFEIISDQPTAADQPAGDEVAVTLEKAAAGGNPGKNTSSDHDHSLSVSKPAKPMDRLTTRPSNSSQPLNPKYTFDTFVTGASNRLAEAASLAVSEAPARAYNPLLIYGGVGLGKTHLMQAIAHQVLEHKDKYEVCYISSETFTNEFIDAIRDGATVKFRNRYRHVDVLLVDDIQFMAGKETTQEEFFHTFNTLHEANKQIVLSSDRPPKEIPTLEERLRSRFEWGLISDIQTPDLETRVAILRKKAQIEGLSIPNEVMNFIGESIDTNIRELEGALIRLIAQASLSDREIDLELAQNILQDIIPNRRPKRVTIDGIMEVVADEYGLTVETLNSRKRTRAIAFPRQIAMYLARTMTDHSLPEIGKAFGGRDHSTVIHAVDKITEQINEDDVLKQKVKHLEQFLKK